MRNVQTIMVDRIAVGHRLGSPLKRVTFTVTIDLDELDRRALKAAGNKSKKSHIGPCFVEVTRVEAE